jgi:hypothetical protein
MNKLNTLTLAIALAASASSNAAMVFKFTAGSATYGETVIGGFLQGQSGANFTYKLKATPDSPATLAKQGSNIGLGVRSIETDTWYIETGEVLNFSLVDSDNNPVAFSLNGFKMGFNAAQQKLGEDERVNVELAGNTYLVGGNPTTEGNNAQILAADCMDANNCWSSDVTATSFRIVGADGVNGVTTSFRLNNVSLDLAPVAAVPVPAAAWLLGSALMGLAVAKRRK